MLAEIMPQIRVKPVRESILQTGEHWTDDKMAVKYQDVQEGEAANVDACVAYFNHVYNTDRQVHPTPFHQALINTDTKFYEDVMAKLDADLKTFVLNSPVIWTTKDSSECPSTYFGIFSQFIKTTYLLLDPGALKLARKETTAEVSSENTDCMNREKWKIELPLSLIAVTGNAQFLTKAIHDGGILLSEDSKGGNLIHDLVKFSNTNPSVAIAMFRDILANLSDTTLKRQVLKHRNRKGHTPLDIAAQNHLPEMFLALINTDDVYKITIKDCLLHKHVLYDVSEYESPVTKQVSPMHYFKALTDEEIQRHDDCKFFKTEPISAWLEARCNTSGHFLVFQYIIWVAYYVTYWFCSYEYLLKEVVHSHLLIILTAISVLVVTNEWVLDLYRLRSDVQATWEFFRNGRVPATLTGVYRKVHNFFAYSCILFSIVHLSGYNCTHKDIGHLLYLASVTFGSLSFLYIIQINKRAGHLLILLLKMLYDATIFLIVGVIFFFTATNIFYSIKFPVETCGANKTTLSLEQGVQRYFDTMFETFLLVFAIKSPSTDFFEVWLEQITSTMYIIAVILFTIILLNMLIGMMAKRINRNRKSQRHNTEVRKNCPYFSILSTVNENIFGSNLEYLKDITK